MVWYRILFASIVFDDTEKQNNSYLKYLEFYRNQKDRGKSVEKDFESFYVWK